MRPQQGLRPTAHSFDGKGLLTAFAEAPMMPRRR
jgi:hypothetical protein